MIRAVLGAILVAAMSACFNPTVQDGQFLCQTGTACPAGFTCACGRCVVRGSASCDMGVNRDGGMGDMAGAMLGGCANGGRVPSDPRVVRVAACPSAWTVPGMLSTATPCNRQPRMNGMNGTTACSAEDNCAPGWHVCGGESELQQRGFTKTHCDALTAESQFFATKQAGGPPMSRQGPPSCSEPIARTIFGCGSLGNFAETTCMLLTRVLVDNPMMSSDECSSLTSGAFLCTGAGDTNPEITVVTKPSIGRGGVLCCQD